MKGNLKSRIASKEVVIGAQLRFGSPAIAEIFGIAGYDYVLLDSEHAPQTPVGIQHQLQAVQGTGATPIVRLGKNDPAQIQVYLDMGAGGILVPMIRTAADAKLGADACYYPPKGTRGYGPARADSYGFDDQYFAKANEKVIFMPVIETVEAVENIESILAVDGLDTFQVGTCDLSIAMGIPFDYEHPRFKEAMQRTLTAASKAGKSAGIGVYGDASDPAVLKSFIDQGFTVFLAGGDQWMLSAGCKRGIQSFEEAKNS